MGTLPRFQTSVIEITTTPVTKIATTTTTTPATMEGVLLEHVQVLVSESGDWEGNDDVVRVTTDDLVGVDKYFVQVLPLHHGVRHSTVGDDGAGLEHSGSLREDIATGQLGSTLISIPVTMTLAPPPLTQSSIREMRESLSVSEVPSSLARYVTNDGDSSKQENDCLSMFSLVHSVHEASSSSKTIALTSSSFGSVRVACGVEISKTSKLSIEDTYYYFNAG